MANAVVEWMPTIKGRNGRIQGTPESCGKRIAGIYRVSEQLGLPTVSKGLVYQTVKAEMRQYALKHGPEWLQSNYRLLPKSDLSTYVLYLIVHLMSHDLFLMSHLMTYAICSHGFGLCLAFGT